MNLFKRMPQAVCAIVTNSQGEVLAVGRTPKTGVPNDWNLPGGKVDGKETLEAAIRREVLEETGFIVEVKEVIHAEACPGEVDYFSTTFRCEIVFGVPKASDEGPVGWMKPSALLADHCRFRDYNAKVFQKVGLTIA